MTDDGEFRSLDVNDGVMRVIEFVEFFRCWKCFSVEDVFVVDVEVRFGVGVVVVDELVVFVVGDVSCVVVHCGIPFCDACVLVVR